MCGILYSVLSPDVTPLLHRGTSYKTMEVPGGFLTQYLLPIQTSPQDEPQPRRLADGSYVAYNGEIFNCRGFKNDTDFVCDVLEVLGIIEGLEYINQTCDGFWSIVVVDAEGNVALTTDPLGKKQLYIDNERNISSEYRGLICEGIDYMTIGEIAASGYCPHSIYESVRRAVPGMIYYNFEAAFVVCLKRKPIVDLYSAIRDSVYRRSRMSLVPVSCFVSGGLDSTIILHHILEDHELNVNLYTISNTEDDQYITILEDHYGVSIQRLQPSPANLSQALIANEVPQDLGSMLPQYELFSAVKDTVVLTGDGADELYGGYNRNRYYDSHDQDIAELAYYHLPRLDRMAAWFTKESRQPFLSRELIEDSFYHRYRGKEVLRDLYRNKIPKQIIERTKHALKSSAVRNNEKEYRYKLIQQWVESKS